MRSREEVEAEVRKKIDNFSWSQKKEVYEIKKDVGARFAKVYLRTEGKAYTNDFIKEHMQHLVDNFEETVKLVVVGEIRRILGLLSEVEKVESIPRIGSEGIGDVCNFTLQDIKDLGLNDPDFVQDYMDEILQSLYEAYGYKEKLPTSEDIADNLDKRFEAVRARVKTSELIRIYKQLELMKLARGEGKYLLDGLPIELREDVEKRIDARLQEVKEEEAKAEEQKISGQELGQATLYEQKDTQAKRTAMEKLAALRTRVKDGDKLQ